MGATYICIPARGPHKWYLPVVGLVAFVALWWFATAPLNIDPENPEGPRVPKLNPRIFPTPQGTLEAFFNSFMDAPEKVIDEESGELVPLVDESAGAVSATWTKFTHSSAIRNGEISCIRIAKSVFWACLIGIPIGVLMGAFGWMESLMSLLVFPMKNAPISAFIPMFMAAFTVGEVFKVNFLTFGTILYAIPLAFDAVRSCPTAVVDRAVDLGFRPLAALWYFALPASLPRIFDAFAICVGISFSYLVTAEIINVTTGLGAAIQYAVRFEQAPKMGSYIIEIILIGLVVQQGVNWTRRLSPLLRGERA